MSYYIHNVPGRLRIKSPIVRRNDNAASEIRKALSEMSGIATVDINLTTGSILINYNPKVVKSKDIVALLQRKGYFDAGKAQTNDQYIKTAASKAGSVLGKAVLGTFVEKAFEGSALSIIGILL
jgi:copper chaperone CopZ